MKIEVIEIDTQKTSTVSQMLIDGRFLCFVIEDGYNEVKVPGQTRIPAGTYPILRRRNGRFFDKYSKEFGHKFSIELGNVPNYSDVLIHIGNSKEDTRGCLLVNMGCFLYPMGEWKGINSTEAYTMLYKLIAAAFDMGQEVTLKIVRKV